MALDRIARQALSCWSLAAAAVPRLLAIAALAATATVAQAQATHTPQELSCYDQGQGKLAWNNQGNKTWNESNLRQLCHHTSNPKATLACFAQAIQTHNEWQRGIKDCAAAAPQAAPQTAPGAPVPAAAGKPALDCQRVKAQGGNNFEMGQCADADLQQANERLHKLTQLMGEALRGTGQSTSQFDRAHSTWLAWRDQETPLCAALNGFDPNGSGWGLMSVRCSTELTRARIQKLEDYLRDLLRR